MENTQTYKIKTKIFEGPLELLVELIEKKKLAINDISLAQVTEDFVNYLKELGSLPISYTANFIITASTLVLIKSKSLLPSLSLTDEEEGSISDLKKRIALYSSFKRIGEKVKSVFYKTILFKRQYSKIEPVFVPDPTLSVSKLHEGMLSALTNLPKKEKVKETIIQKAITIEEMMDNLTDRIKETISFSFKQFSGNKSHKNKEEKVFIIVSFLAILELVKQGIVSVRQEQDFEDIQVEKMEAIPLIN